MEQTAQSRKANIAYQIVTALLILAVVLGGVAGIAKYVRVFSPENTLQVPVHIRAENLSSFELPKGLEAEAPIPVTANIEDPGGSQVAMSMVMDLGLWILWVASLLILRAVVGSIRGGEPFGVANVGRLRKLGIVVLLTPVVQFVNALLLGGILAQTPLNDELSTSTSIDFGPAAAGLVVLLLAEVFAHGVRLRQDVEGTV